jgi:hypothetical protein
MPGSAADGAANAEVFGLSTVFARRCFQSQRGFSRNAKYVYSHLAQWLRYKPRSFQ